ncbi:alpha/beta hydrolase [Luteimonas gilva]|uniref:Alpha/beta hydrolase n=1 Tax=Luteimonas gilva TaxID=2572684 RepID=A0A4U5JSV1_9GAMM|nr:alpha/beta hydrolase [Luteimonas gilva]TKR32892.1 alpha/beta hydrolase [Luteimonas gilva]
MIRREFLMLFPAAAAVSLASRMAWAAGGDAAVWTPAEFHAARRFADLKQGKIAYVERGSGPVALFLHGYPLNGYQWRGPMAALAGERRCLAPDLMGLGYTDVAADADLSPEAQTAMVVALLDHLKIDDVDIVANDSSTGIAQLMAAYHPQRVRSMLLTNGDVDTNSPPAKLMPFLEKARRGEGRLWFDKSLADNAWARSRDAIGNAYHAPERLLTHELIETYFRPLVAPEKRRKQVEEYGLDMFPNPLLAVREQLRAFAKPVRMVWGRDDDLFPVETAYWLDRTFPGSRGVRVVENARLFFPEEYPELVIEEARKLWT